MCTHSGADFARPHTAKAHIPPLPLSHSHQACFSHAALSLEQGEFAKASKQELAQRRIVQVKRKPRDATPAGSNPFAGVSLFGAKPAAPAAPAAGAGPSDAAEKPAGTCAQEAQAFMDIWF